MTVPFIRLDGVRASSKKLATEIKSKLAAFGVELNLSRSYELLATLSGYRNWSTMAAAEPSDKGAILIGFQQSYSSHGEDVSKSSLKRIELPFSIARNHIEIVGEGYLTNSLIALAESAMTSGAPVVVLSANAGISDVARAAVDSGRAMDFATRSVGNYEEGKRYEPFRGMTSSEIVAFVEIIARSAEVVRDDYWVKQITFLAEVAAQLSGPSPTVKDYVDVMRLDSLLKIHHGGGNKLLAAYLTSLPQFDPSSMEQNQVVRDQNGYPTLVISSFLSRLIDGSIGIKEGSLEGRTPVTSPFDEAFAGGVVHVTYPQPARLSDFNLQRLLLAELTARLGSFSATDVPPVILFDEANAIEPLFLEDVLVKCRAAGVVCVLCSEQRLPLSGLKQSTTIHVRGSEASFITPTQTVHGQEPGRLSLRPILRAGASPNAQYLKHEMTFRQLLSVK